MHRCQIELLTLQENVPREKLLFQLNSIYFCSFCQSGTTYWLEDLQVTVGSASLRQTRARFASLNSRTTSCATASGLYMYTRVSSRECLWFREDRTQHQHGRSTSFYASAAAHHRGPDRNIHRLLNIHIFLLDQGPLVSSTRSCWPRRVVYKHRFPFRLSKDPYGRISKMVQKRRNIRLPHVRR